MYAPFQTRLAGKPYLKWRYMPVWSFEMNIHPRSFSSVHLSVGDQRSLRILHYMTNKGNIFPIEEQRKNPTPLPSGVKRTRATAPCNNGRNLPPTVALVGKTRLAMKLASRDSRNNMTRGFES